MCQPRTLDLPPKEKKGLRRPVTAAHLPPRGRAPGWEVFSRAVCVDAPHRATLLSAFLTGDEILELNGESMAGLTHQDALQKFKVTACYQYIARLRGFGQRNQA